MSVVRSIAVVGHDAPLWLAASVLRRALAPLDVGVTAVELPPRASPGDFHATHPALEALHAKLGLEEDVLLGATGGCFSYGRNLVGFGAGGEAHMLAWADYGVPIDGHPFFGHWLRARRGGLSAALQDFCVAAVAAKNGRMLLPDDELRAFGRADYGYHLPALAYAALLRRVASAVGVSTIRANTVALTAGGDALNVDGQSLGVDLYVDTSGAISTGETTPAGAARRVLTARAPALATLPPYAEVRADDFGWTVLYPSRDATRVLRCTMSNSSDDAVIAAATHGAGLTQADIVLQDLAPAVSKTMWRGRAVSLGRAAARLDPLHIDELYLVQLGLVRLLALLPVSDDWTIERREFDRAMRSHIDRIVDFQAATYAGATRRGAFWADASASAEVEHKLATFAARGEIAPMEDETFSPAEWQALLLALGIEPSSYSPLYDRTDPRHLGGELRRMLGFIAEKVRAQPTHDAYLASLSPERAA